MVLAASLMILITLGLLMSSRASPVVAFVVVPLVMAAIAGFPASAIFKFSVAGMHAVSPIVALFVFAILYFSLMSEQGLFDPLVQTVVRRAGANASLVMMTTVLVTAICHLDGAGATTYVITITAFLPIYRRLHINTLHLPMIAGMTAGIMNMLPWTPATLRAASVLKIDPVDLWRPLLIPQLIGLAATMALAWWLGSKVRHSGPVAAAETQSDLKSGLKVSKFRYIFNLSLTIAVIFCLVAFPRLPGVLVFMVGLAVALTANYGKAKDQMNMIKRHASEALLLAAVLFCAGIFLGILTHSGMLDQLANALVSIMPGAVGPYIHLILGVFAAPIGMGIGSDAYYFGILPVAVKIVASYGVSPQSVAHAMMIGENVGFAISPMVGSAYLAAGLAEVDFGQHLRHAFFFTWVVSWVVLLAAIGTGAIQI